MIRRGWILLRQTWGCSLFLLSYGCDKSRYYRVPHGTGLIPNETRFPCRTTVQGPVKEQQPDGMSHRGGGGAMIFSDPHRLCTVGLTAEHRRLPANRSRLPASRWLFHRQVPLVRCQPPAVNCRLALHAARVANP